MIITMQDYDEIRRRYNAGESQRQIAKSLGIFRNTVKKYCEGNEDADEHLKKQNHTAKRIYNRLVAERGFTGGETTMRAKVHELKEAMPKAFVIAYHSQNGQHYLKTQLWLLP